MSITDPLTARLLSDRMVGSFFEGLSKAERIEMASGQSSEAVMTMLAYTLDVYLELLSLPEDQGKEFFKEAVQKKLKALRKEGKAKRADRSPGSRRKKL